MTNLLSPKTKRKYFLLKRQKLRNPERGCLSSLLYVQQRLGHRSVLSTMRYTQLVNFESDDYHVKTVQSLKEDEELISAGLEYVTERDGVKIYRKRK